MSHSNGDNETAGAVTTTLELRLEEIAPANDTTPEPAAAPAAAFERAGPLGLPRTFWVLAGGMLLNRLGGAVFVFLSIYLTRQRGLGPEIAGLVISLNAAGGLFAGPVGGVLADRVGRRTMLLVGTALSGALMLALGLVRSTIAIVAIAPCLGFFTDVCRPPLMAAVADVVAPADRARAYGLLYWAVNLGFAAAAAFGGALAEHHFTLLFVIDALTTFAYGAIVLVGVPETRPAPAPAATTPRVPAVRRLVAPLRDRRLVVFVLIQLLALVAFAQVLVALPLDMRAHGLGTAQIGWLLALNGVGIVIAQPIALRAAARFSHAQCLTVGALLIGVGLGATAFAGGAVVYAPSVLLWTMGEIAFSIAAPTLVAGLAPADQRGAYQGTYQLAWGIGNTTAPAIGSLVLARFGSTALWAGCLVVCLAAAALHTRFTGRMSAASASSSH
jgi:predicted MFS family arabinose efflux permease